MKNQLMSLIQTIYCSLYFNTFSESYLFFASWRKTFVSLTGRLAIHYWLDSFNDIVWLPWQSIYVIVALGHYNNKIEKPQIFAIVIMIVYAVKNNSSQCMVYIFKLYQRPSFYRYIIQFLQNIRDCKIYMI